MTYIYNKSLHIKNYYKNKEKNIYIFFLKLKYKKNYKM